MTKALECSLCVATWPSSTSLSQHFRKSHPESRSWQRVMAQVRKDANDCWIWSGAVSQAGYGVTCVGKRQFLTHRVIYEAFRGSIHPSMEIDHLCRVRHCVNPNHLEVVTTATNLRRGMGTKLTAEQVLAIRHSGERARSLADQYGVDISHIYALKRQANRYWKGLNQ